MEVQSGRDASGLSANLHLSSPGRDAVGLSAEVSQFRLCRNLDRFESGVVAKPKEAAAAA